MLTNRAEDSSCDSSESEEINNSNLISPIIINEKLSELNNGETIHSKESYGSAHDLIKLMRIIDAKRNERVWKKTEESEYINQLLPEPENVGFYSNVRNYKQKLSVYNFLHHPRGWKSYTYHLFVFFMVFACLILTVFSTIKQFSSTAWKSLVTIEIFMVLLFASEFILRLWASECKPKYLGFNGKLLFLRGPFRIIDLVVIISLVIVLYAYNENGNEACMTAFAAAAFHGFHRFFHVLQMTRMGRQFKPWKIMYSVIFYQKEQLIICAYTSFLILSFGAFLSYLSERSSNEGFSNLARALWWSVDTFTTVGNGDPVPITWLGKMIGGAFMLIGACIFSLPVGIIGTGLAIRVQEEHRRIYKIKKKVPAAVLIQCAWRCHASSFPISLATWTRSRVLRGNSLTEREINAVRFIRIVKFFVAKSKFTTQRRPANVGDVLEQYERGHSDVLGRFNTLQKRVNSIVDNFGFSSVKLSRKNSLDLNIVNIDDIKRIEKKLDTQNEYVMRTSKDISIILTLVQLLHENSNVAYDNDNDNIENNNGQLKYALELYERGHNYILERIKTLQNRLNHYADKIGTNSNASRSNSSDSRIETVEDIVKDIDGKILIQNEFIQQIVNDRSAVLTLTQLWDNNSRFNERIS